MPLTIKLTHEFYNNYKGTNGDKSIINFIRSKGIKFNDKTEKIFDVKELCIYYIQHDVYSLDETDHQRYAKAFEEFLVTYFSEIPFQSLNLNLKPPIKLNMHPAQKRFFYDF